MEVESGAGRLGGRSGSGSPLCSRPGDAACLRLCCKPDMSSGAAAWLRSSAGVLQWESWARDLVSDHESGERLSVRGSPAVSRISGAILADQAKALDWRIRQAEFICKVSRENTVEVSENQAGFY